MVIVIEAPTIDDPAGIFQASKQFTIQELVAEAAVEALNVAIFPGAPFGDEQGLHARLVQPARHRPSHELRTVVAPQVFGNATNSEQVAQHIDHLPSSP